MLLHIATYIQTEYTLVSQPLDCRQKPYTLVREHMKAGRRARATVVEDQYDDMCSTDF